MIGGSTGTMLEALEVVGDGYNGPIGEVSPWKLIVKLIWFIYFTPLSYVIFLQATKISGLVPFCIYDTV